QIGSSIETPARGSPPRCTRTSTDIRQPGRLPIRQERSYRSSARATSSCTPQPYRYWVAAKNQSLRLLSARHLSSRRCTSDALQMQGESLGWLTISSSRSSARAPLATVDRTAPVDAHAPARAARLATRLDRRKFLDVGITS